MLDLYYVFDVCSCKFYKSRSFCLVSTVFVLDLTNKEIFTYYIGSLEERYNALNISIINSLERLITVNKI